MTAHPDRTAGLAAVVAMVAGAASEAQDAEGHSHCDCCGHRYGGDHVPGRVCPCFEREGRP